MSEAKLCLHAGARVIGLEELERLPMPMPLGARHAPPHPYAVVGALKGALIEHDLGIFSERYAAQRGDSMFFGVINVQRGQEKCQEVTAALGIRWSTQQALSIQMVGGVHIFVCDNMAFHGDTIVLRRKSTTGLRLRDEMHNAVGRWKDVTKEAVGLFERWAEARMPREEAMVVLFNLVMAKVIPQRYMVPAYDAWRHEETPDTNGMTVWSLHNAVTRQAKDEPLNRKMRIGQQVTNALEKFVHA